MKGYLLDTSICVAIFRGNRHVAMKMNEVGKERCFITRIVVAELLLAHIGASALKRICG